MASNDSSIAWRSLTKDSPLRPLRETYFLRPLRGAPPFVVMIAWASIRFPFLPSVASSAFFTRGLLFASPTQGSTVCRYDRLGLNPLSLPAFRCVLRVLCARLSFCVSYAGLHRLSL
jgi:hypothetical protein